MNPTDIDEQRREVRLLDPASVRRSPYQVRAEEDDYAELEASIATHGLLNPITVRADEDGRAYELIAGHRRLGAWIHTRGSQPIPAIVLAADDMAAEDLLVAENFVRKDLTPIEQALTVQQLRDHGRTVEQTATVVRKSTRWVQRFSAIAGIGEPWRSHLARARSSYPRCLAVAQLPSGLRGEAWISFCSVVHDGKKDEAWWKDEERGMPAFLAKLRFLDAAHCPFDCGRACRKCAKRSDHAPELWDEDAARSPRCLDPQCYDRHVAEAEAKAAAKKAAEAARRQSISAPAQAEDARPIANAGPCAGAETSSESVPRTEAIAHNSGTVKGPEAPKAGDPPALGAAASADGEAASRNLPASSDPPASERDFCVRMGAVWAFATLLGGSRLEDLIPEVGRLRADDVRRGGWCKSVREGALPRLSRNRDEAAAALAGLATGGMW